MLTCYIIDDDDFAIQLLKQYISLKPILILLKAFNNPKIALDEIQKFKKVDIIFMDIEMPDINGIELAEFLKYKTEKIVFTTGHANYALLAYELGADGFLLKPFSFLKFDNVVEKIESSMSRPVRVINQEHIDSVVIKHAHKRGKKSKIYFKDIVLIESKNNHIIIRTNHEEIMVFQKLHSFYNIIKDKKFIQVHRSFIVSLHHIKALDHKTVLLNNGQEIPIGRKYKREFMTLFSNNY